MLLLLAALCTSASPILLRDLTPGAAVDSETYLEVDTGADPNVLVVQNDFWGTELFTILDGRRSLVIDLCPGPCSGNPTQLTRLGARLFFLASDVGDGPRQLWITDGTAVGTQKLADGVPLAAANIVLLGEQLLFMKGADLWVSNGTLEGTRALTWGVNRQLSSGQATAQHRFISVNPSACELFVTGLDVTQATALPMPAAGESCVEPLVVLGERAFVGLTSGVWRFDATPGPAVKIDAPATTLTRVGAGLFFFRSAPLSLGLFQSNGEPGGTTALGSVASDGVEHAAATASKLLYTARSPTGVGHLYASDGTVAGTRELPFSATVTHAIQPVGPVAFVVAALGTTGTALVETDGTPSGTVVLQGVRPAHANPQPGHREAKGHAVALALIAEVVNEVGAFRIRPGEDPESIFLKPGNPKGSVLTVPVVAGDAAFFNAGGKAYATDGTADASFPFSDAGFVGLVGNKVLVSDGVALSSLARDGGEVTALGAFAFPVAVGLGETAVFSAGAGARTLWRTDGTAAGTTVLADLGAPGSNVGGPLRLQDGRAVFTSENTVWFSDGTVAGTKSVAVPGLSGAPVASNAAVWVVSGPTSVTRVTADAALSVPLAPGGAGPELLTARGDELFFLTRSMTAADLWRTSGASVAKLATLKTARGLAIHKGRLMVLGDRENGQQLLELLEAGLVARAPAPGATFLQVAGETLFADVASPTEGQELHYFQESPIFFSLPVADLSPGPGSSSPSRPVAFGKKFLFSAWTPEAGRELWSWEPDPAAAPPRRGCGCGADAGAVMLLGLALWAWVGRSPSRQ